MNWTSNSSIYVYERYPDGLFIKRFVPSAFYLKLFAYPIWFFIGVIGNALSFLIWSSRRQRNLNSSAVYLAILAMSDFFLILLMFIFYLKRYLVVDSIISRNGFCQLFQGFYLFFQYYSIALTFGFTLERWLSICYPFKRYKMGSTRKAILGVSILAIVVAIANSFYVYVWEVYMGECIISEIWQNETSFHIYITTNECVFSLLFPLATLIFNILVLREMSRLARNKAGFEKLQSACCAIFLKDRRRSRTNAECFRISDQMNNASMSTETTSFQASTIMLIILSFYLIICTLPAGIVFLIQIRYTSAPEDISDEEILNNTLWKEYFKFWNVKEVIDFLCASHYACNFFIYLFTGRSFRLQLFALLTCKTREKHTKFITVRRERCQLAGLTNHSLNPQAQHELKVKI